MRLFLTACMAVLVAMVGLAVPAVAAAPTISSFTPTSGPLRTSVKITGSNFVAPVTVKFNGTAATSVVVNSSTQLTAQVPGSANSGPVSVTSGGATATSASSFTVTPGVYLPVTPGPPGSKVAVYFSGFAAYEAVDIYFDSTDLKLVSASSTGSGVATPFVPAKAGPGEHFFSAVGRKSGSSAQGTFTVRTDWPQYGGDPAHTNQNSLESTLGASTVKKLSRAWSSATKTNAGVAYTQVVVAAGIVYAASDTGVTALSASTGGTLWSRNVGSVLGTPAVSGSTVVMGTYTGHLVGLDALTGAVKYDRTYNNQYFYKPVTAADGVGYIEADNAGAPGASLVAFDMATGTQRWSSVSATQCDGAAVAEAMFLANCNGSLTALRRSDGSLVYNTPTTDLIDQGSPLVMGGLVVSAGFARSFSYQGGLFAYDLATGSVVWSLRTDINADTYVAPVAADDEVVVSGFKNSARVTSAYSAADGTPIWSTGRTATSDFPMTTANGLLYVPGDKATVVYDVSSGGRVTTLQGGEFAVVVDAGVYTALNGTAVSRYSLPASVTSARRPDAANLRLNTNLKVAS